MCVKMFFPDPPDPTAPPPAKKADPVIKPLAKPKALLSPEDISKVDYGNAKKQQGGKDAPRITADSLKINLGGTEQTSDTGGLNV